MHRAQAPTVNRIESPARQICFFFLIFIILFSPKQARDRERIIVGRIVVAILVGISLLWLPVVKGGSQHKTSPPFWDLDII